MTRSSKTVLMMGVALFALSACSGGKGPGELGSKNDIVVRNHGEARQPVPAGDFSTTVETAAAVPPAQVELGEAVPAMDGDVAADMAAQAVAEQSVPVASSVTAPINDGTPSAATVPAQQYTPETPIPEMPVTQAAPAPQLSEQPYAQPRVQDAQQATAQAPASYISRSETSSAQVPAGEPLAQPEDVAATLAPVVAAPVSEPAPAVAQAPAPVAVPSNPNAPFYEYVKAGEKTSAQPVAGSSAPVAAAASGDVSKVKAALAARGLYAGAQNDAVDSEFLNALAKYQGENGLPMGGVNAQTKQHLGIAQ